MIRLARPLAIALGLLAIWELVVRATGVPHFILPAPTRIAAAFAARGDLLFEHAVTTLVEILLGFVVGGGLGTLLALTLAASATARRWLLPLVIASQAVPVFAIAPLLVLWLGYGLTSKIAMAALVIFFPVAIALHDGLKRTEPGWIDLAQTMTAGRRGGAARILFRIRLPAALPALGSGLRVAAGVAPIGAVIGEWVGSSAGLGYLMLHANARLQVDLMFAALLVLAVMATLLYLAVDRLVRRLVPWAPDASTDLLSTETG
ncbi:ABC transporter permease [Desertibaculum subflavum]|uniref:ABC transporter permease n=1 Tax=Desertibaculum subflavum TaxID=2268458 RepID=UPI000E660638